MGDQRAPIRLGFKASVFLNAGFNVVPRNGRGAKQNFELGGTGLDCDPADVMFRWTLQGFKHATIPGPNAIMPAESGIDLRHVPIHIWVEVRQERVDRIQPVEPGKPVGDETADFGVIGHLNHLLMVYLASRSGTGASEYWDQKNVFAAS